MTQQDKDKLQTLRAKMAAVLTETDKPEYERLLKLEKQETRHTPVSA